MGKPVITKDTKLNIEQCTKCLGTGWHIDGCNIPCDMCDQRGWFIRTYVITANDYDVMFPKIPEPPR